MPSQAGFTLVETLVAMTIFAVMLPATVGVVTKTTTGVIDNRSRVVAAGLAAAQIEIVRGAAASTSSTANLPTPSPASLDIGGRTYTISQSTATVDVEGQVLTCLTSALSDGYTRVSVSVAWTGMGTSSPATADTLVRGNQFGAVAVSVTDALDQPQAGLPVTLTSSTTGATSTATTDSTGCATFTGLAAGQYGAGLNSVGYTGPDNAQQASSAPIVVSAHSVSKAVLKYSRSMSLTARFTVADGSAAVSASQLAQIPSELQTGSAQGIGTTAVTAGPLVGGSLSPLYPTTYSVMGGPGTQCTLASVDLSDGTPTSQTVDIPTADVKVSNWATLLAIGSIRAIWVGPTTGSGDISCPVGTTFNTGTVFSLSGDHRATLPLGRWKIQVPWNIFGTSPIPGLTVFCYSVNLTSASTGVTMIDFSTWVVQILANIFSWASGGC